MSNPRPRFITFDCYGTLTHFQMAEMGREIFAGSVTAENMERVVKDFAAYRLDEVLGAWKPYVDVIRNSFGEPVASGRSSTAMPMPCASTRQYPPGAPIPTCPNRWRELQSTSRS